MSQVKPGMDVTVRHVTTVNRSGIARAVIANHPTQRRVSVVYSDGRIKDNVGDVWDVAMSPEGLVTTG